jgi:hypothetical protein
MPSPLLQAMDTTFLETVQEGSTQEPEHSSLGIDKDQSSSSEVDPDSGLLPPLISHGALPAPSALGCQGEGLESESNRSFMLNKQISKGVTQKNKFFRQAPVPFQKLLGVTKQTRPTLSIQPNLATILVGSLSKQPTASPLPKDRYTYKPPAPRPPPDHSRWPIPKKYLDGNGGDKMKMALQRNPWD